MADEIRYNDAKQRWLQAAKQARQQKDRAKEAYGNEKESGFTDQKFEAWVVQNYPAFVAAYQNFQASAAAAQAAWTQYDQGGAQEWQQQYQQKYKELYYQSPEDSDDHHSNFLIITPDE